MAESSRFTWVQTHKEIVQYLKNMKDRQTELIAQLERAGVGNFTDRDASGETFKLNEMEPFTFFFYIYKYGATKSLLVLQNLARSLGLSVPIDADGVPSANAISVRIFPQKDIRTHDEVNRLWALFHKTITHTITDDDFDDALQIVSVGKAKLTEAFFVVDPEFYLCIDGQTKPYIKEVLGIDPKFNTYSEYVAILQKVREKTDIPFPELSFTAWMWNTKHNQPNYWVFQCNPNVYDIVSALRGKMEARWRVAQHTKDIKVGDRVILWVTGPQAGCYALGEISGELEYGVRDIEDQKFYKDNSFNVPGDRVMIKLVYNLVEHPISKSSIEGVKMLNGLNVGLQGTNFTATEKQYKALEKLALESGSAKGTKRYWIYTPGSNGDKWGEFFEQGIMAIGWDELGDLSQFTNKEEVEVELRKLSGQNDVKKTNDALANWQFKHEISIGDIILAKKGQTVFLGYGEVTSDFQYDQGRSEYRKFREVLWKVKGEWEMRPPHLVIAKTLTDITGYPTSHSNYIYYQDLALAVMNDEVTEPQHQTDHPVNFILFGPPGTGKTYNSINLAVEIADPAFVESQAKQMSRTAIKDRYKELVTEGRVVFTTFHQSMSYEDFIEGIKPITNEDQGNSLTYEVVPGIFKRLCDRAAMSDNNNFEQAYMKLIEELEGYENQYMKLKTPTGKEFGISLNSKNNLNLFTGPDFAVHAALNKDILISHILGKNTPEYFKGYYQGVLTHMNSRHGFDDKRKTCNNYVLIIDEINRGNVSQIFGELITLIEPDKRSGNREELDIILPYSKEKFSVPKNLYIIGTMNTADRSVEALDTALRRRFSFTEMAPDFSLLAGSSVAGIDLGKLLRIINSRIEGLLDKDHAIGHSYFLRVAKGESTLEDVFFDEIIPLLQEYFYGNFGRIELVLGRGFVKSSTVTQSIFAKPSPDNDEFNNHIRYFLVRREEMDENAFQKALRVLMNESDEA